MQFLNWPLEGSLRSDLITVDLLIKMSDTAKMRTHTEEGQKSNIYIRGFFSFWRNYFVPNHTQKLHHCTKNSMDDSLIVSVQKQFILSPRVATWGTTAWFCWFNRLSLPRWL